MAAWLIIGVLVVAPFTLKLKEFKQKYGWFEAVCVVPISILLWPLVIFAWAVKAKTQ